MLSSSKFVQFSDTIRDFQNFVVTQVEKFEFGEIGKERNRNGSEFAISDTQMFQPGHIHQYRHQRINKLWMAIFKNNICDFTPS